MFFKHKVINLYPVLLDKFHMNFIGTKQALMTDQRNASKTLVTLEDTVWHRSKSPRF